MSHPKQTGMPNASKFDERERDLPNTAGLTFREIGARWGVTTERARQVVEALKRKAAIRARKAAVPHPLTDDVLVEDLALRHHTLYCLQNDSIKTVGAVRGMTDAELLRIPNFGRKSLHELRGVIREGFTPR